MRYKVRDYKFMTSIWNGYAGFQKFVTCLRVLLFLNNRFFVHFCGRGHKLVIIGGCHKYMISNFKFHFFKICIKFSECPYFHLLYRSSRPEVLLRKGALKICSKFTEEHPCRCVISKKLQNNMRKVFCTLVFNQQKFVQIIQRYCECEQQCSW